MEGTQLTVVQRRDGWVEVRARAGYGALRKVRCCGTAHLVSTLVSRPGAQINIGSDYGIVV